MIVGYSIVPLEFLIGTILVLLIVNPTVYGLKIIPRIDPETGQREWVKLVKLIETPWRLAFDENISQALQRTDSLFKLTTAFVFAYVRVFFCCTRKHIYIF